MVTIKVASIVFWMWILVDRTDSASVTSSCKSISKTSGRIYLNNKGTKSTSPTVTFSPSKVSVTSPPRINSLASEKGYGCYQSWLAFEKYANEWHYQMLLSKSRIVQVETTYYETTKTVREGTFYTECDNIPRFRPSRNASVSLTTSTFSVEHTGYAADLRRIRPDKYPEPPKCHIPEPLCLKLLDNYYANEGKENNPHPWAIGGEGCADLAHVDNRYCFVDFNQEIVLLYWPPEVENRDICDDQNDLFAKWKTKTSPITGAPRSITTTAISFRGQDLHELNHTLRMEGMRDFIQTTKLHRVGPSVLYGNFTFISPTIYIAHHPITASIQPYSPDRNLDRLFIEHAILDMDNPEFEEVKNGLQRTQIAPAGTFAVNVKDILTKRLPISASGASQMLDYVRSIAMGRYNDIPLAAQYTSIEPFLPIDLADLIEPVPASIYYNAREDCFGKQSHCGVIEDDTYRPNLLLKFSAFRRLFPNHANCLRPLMVDPPITLQALDPFSTIAEATLPTLTPASPGSGIVPVSAPTGAQTQANIESPPQSQESGPSQVSSVEIHSASAQEAGSSDLDSDTKQKRERDSFSESPSASSINDNGLNQNSRLEPITPSTSDRAANFAGNDSAVQQNSSLARHQPSSTTTTEAVTSSQSISPPDKAKAEISPTSRKKNISSTMIHRCWQNWEIATAFGAAWAIYMTRMF